MRVRLTIVAALALGLASCGRDNTSLLESEGRDGGPRPEGRPPPLDTGVGFPPEEDTGVDVVPSVDGGDVGFPPLPDTGVDAGVFVPEVGVPDLGFNPFPDTGVLPPLDTGVSPDATVALDGGVFCRVDQDCAAFGDQCRAATCDTSRSVCVVRPVRDGTPCDDGQVCTAMDACRAGTCEGLSTVPTNDTCATPQTLTLPVGRTTRSGNTSCGSDDEQGACLSSGGRDVVYRFSLSDPRRVRINTVQPPTGTGFDTALYLRSSCTTASSELACNDDGSSNNRLSVIDEDLDPGTYFAFVDGANGASNGSFQVNFEVDPQNVCVGASALTLPPTNQTLVVRGTTSGGSDDFRAQCGLSTGPDHVYQITVRQDTRVRFETRTTTGQYDTVLHLHPAPCTQGFRSRTACDDDGGIGELSRFTATLTAGTWFLVVDGFRSGAGRYELAVTTLPAASPPFTVTFPAAGDFRLTASSTTGDRFNTRGDLVEGNRTLPIDTWVRAQISLRVTNNLSCGTLRVQPQLDRSGVGTLSIGPGDTVINQSFTLFSPLSGGSTNIRFEVFGTLPANCGWVDFPNGVSTITFRTN